MNLLRYVMLPYSAIYFYIAYRVWEKPLLLSRALPLAFDPKFTTIEVTKALSLALFALALARFFFFVDPRGKGIYLTCLAMEITEAVFFYTCIFEKNKVEFEWELLLGSARIIAVHSFMGLWMLLSSFFYLRSRKTADSSMKAKKE